MKVQDKLLRIVCASTLAVAMMPVGAMSAFAVEGQDDGYDGSNSEIVFETEDIFDYPEGQDHSASLAAVLPTKFDLRDQGRVTSVKYQNPWGSCWSFAAIGSAETSILSELGTTYAATGLDLSEHHLAWFAKNHIPAAGEAGYDSQNSQAGEGFYWRNLDDPDSSMSGGISEYATATFASGAGPVSEELAPYRGNAGKVRAYKYGSGWGDYASYDAAVSAKATPYYYAKSDDWSVSESLRFSQEYELEESYILPNIEGSKDDLGNYVLNSDGIAAVKEQLMAGRAVQIGYDADDDYLNESTWSQFVWEDQVATHAVLIVGWDDDYDVGTFQDGDGNTIAPEKGAWIVKNSWGSKSESFPNYSDWGVDGKGYFYISYYDMSLDDPEAFDFLVGDEVSSDTYTTCYQYDYMPSNAYRGYTWAYLLASANVFQVEKNETLTEIACLTNKPDSTVEYWVYLIDDGVSDPRSGQLVASGTKTFSYGGYHRFSLEASVPLNANQKFSVVVAQSYMDGGTKTYSLPINCGVNKSYAEVNDRDSYSVGVVNSGESYAIGPGGWNKASDWSEELSSRWGSDTNYTFDNPAIKAFTVASLEEPDLAVYAQLPSEVDWESATSTDVRLAFGIESLDYQSAGLLFSLSTTEATAANDMIIGATGVKNYSATNAYSKIYDGNMLKLASTVFGSSCKYAIAVKVTGLPSAFFNRPFYVRAYTIDSDGNVAYGAPRAIVVSQLAQ